MDLDELAPGLRTLGDNIGSLRDLWPPDPAPAESYVPLVVLGIVGYLIVCFGLRTMRLMLFGDSSVAKTSAALNNEARAGYQQPVKLPKVGNRGAIDKRLHTWQEPVSIAGVTVETKDRHIAIGATTGARKTTLIANLIMQARRPCVVIAGDNSPYAKEAMLARGWRIWSADGKHGGLYVFEGTPNEAAQIITVLLNPRRTAGDTGLQRGMARGVFRAAITAMDDAGVRRSWPALAEALYVAEPPRGLTNRNFDAAKANWLARIDELMEALGPALGHDISVLDCVRSECGLFFDLNAFSDLDMATCFGEAAVRLTQHAADKTGDFWWICDELALFDADLLGQIVRTCRIRRVKFVGASQIISDFGKVLRGLVKTWFVGEQTAADQESRDWCSKLTMGYAPPENFAEHATPPGFYYVVADGRTQTIQLPWWHHPKAAAPQRVYSSRPVAGLAASPAQTGEVRTNAGVNAEEWEDEADAESEEETVSEAEALLHLLKHQPHRIGPIQTPDWVSGKRLRPEQRDRGQLAEIWRRHVFPYGVDGCYETDYSVNLEGANGRPRCGYMSQSWLVYALVLAVHEGLDLDVVKEEMKAKKRSADHKCENNRCVRIEHLQWKDSTGANSAAYHQRRRETLRLLTTGAVAREGTA